MSEPGDGGRRSLRGWVGAASESMSQRLREAQAERSEAVR